MANISAPRDNNRIPVLIGTSSSDGTTPVTVYVDPTTHRLKVDASSTANIIIGTSTITSGTDKGILYDNAGVVGEYTPSASLILATDASKNVVGLSTATYPSLTELSYVKGVTSAIQTQINAKGAGTVTSVSVTTANGVSGSVATATTTPAITLTLGAITPTTVNGNTFTTGSYTLTGTAAKTLNFTNTLTLSGTDSTTMTFPTTSATIARTDAGNTFTGVQVMTSPSITTATFNGANVLAENSSIQLDPAGSADGKYSGITVTGVAGYTVGSGAFGDLIYLAVADSRWEKTDADALATAGNVILGMMLTDAPTDGVACNILLMGNIRADAKFPALTVGAGAYVGETAGAIQVAIPTGADNIIRVVGFALTADEIYFNPSQDWQVTVA